MKLLLGGKKKKGQKNAIGAHTPPNWRIIRRKKKRKKRMLL